MLADKDLLEHYEKDKLHAESRLGAQHRAAKEAHKAYAGDDMAYTATVEDKGSRRMVVFNKIQPYVDSVVGTMIQVRRKPDYNARVEDNQEMVAYSGYMNSLSDYSRSAANIDFIETQQDREMVIAGYGALDTGLGYEKNPDGEVVAECLRFDDVFWDPMAKESNLLDARFVYRKKPFSKEEAEERFEDEDIEEFEAYTGMKGSAEYNPDGGVYDKIQIDGADTGMVQVVYYQWWDLIPYYRVENPALSIENPDVRQEVLTLMAQIEKTRYEISDADEQEDLFRFDPNSDYLSLTPEQYGDIKALANEYGLTVKAVKQRRKCYYTALITGKKVLRKFKSPNQEGFTIKFKTANYDPTTRLWYGLVRNLMNPAEFANKSITEMLFAIASNSKGGVMYEEDAVADPRRFEQQWATTKAAIQVNAGALGAGKIQPKAQAALPTGYEMIYTLADNALPEAAGISKEFLGTAQNKQVSALLESQRINQVLATLANYFDAISLYQVEHARLMITYLRMLAQNSQGRLIRIIGKDGASFYEKLTEDRMTDEYDIDISEAPTTPAQKSQTTEIMLNLAQQLSQIGVNIYATVIPYLPIKQKDKMDLIKALTPSPEQQAMQQQETQRKQAQEDAMNKVIAEATMAKAKRDMAEAIFKQASMPKLSAEIDNTHADTAKTLEEARRTSLEVSTLRSNPPSEVSVNI